MLRCVGGSISPYSWPNLSAAAAAAVYVCTIESGHWTAATRRHYRIIYSFVYQLLVVWRVRVLTYCGKFFVGTFSLCSCACIFSSLSAYFVWYLGYSFRCWLEFVAWRFVFGGGPNTQRRTHTRHPFACGEMAKMYTESAVVHRRAIFSIVFTFSQRKGLGG